MENIIQYGIGADYLESWTVSDAIREIFQNFRDSKDYQMSVELNQSENLASLVFVNKFNPETLDFLRIGYSSKRNSTDSVGCHGEGLKVAMMILLRNNIKFKITVGPKELISVWVKTDIGQCFGIKLVDTESDGNCTVVISAEESVIDGFYNSIIREEDVIFNSCYGNIVNKPKGNIYVGGIFVANLEKISYSYDFRPNQIILDRDRRIPSCFDVEWAASQIMRLYKDLTIEDLKERDCAYISSVPEVLSKKLKPVIVGGKIVFESKKHGVMPDNITKVLLNNDSMMKKVTRLQYTMTTRKSPENELKDFLEEFSMSGMMRVKFETIIKKSKNWKNK